MDAMVKAKIVEKRSYQIRAMATSLLSNCYERHAADCEDPDDHVKAVIIYHAWYEELNRLPECPRREEFVFEMLEDAFRMGVSPMEVYYGTPRLDSDAAEESAAAVAAFVENTTVANAERTD